MTLDPAALPDPRNASILVHVGGRLLRFAAWSAGGANMKSACATLDALAGLPAWAADRPRDTRIVPLRLPE